MHCSNVAIPQLPSRCIVIKGVSQPPPPTTITTCIAVFGVVVVAAAVASLNFPRVGCFRRRCCRGCVALSYHRRVVHAFPRTVLPWLADCCVVLNLLSVHASTKLLRPCMHPAGPFVRANPTVCSSVGAPPCSVHLRSNRACPGLTSSTVCV